jgi:hypothetical protein
MKTLKANFRRYHNYDHATRKPQRHKAVDRNRVDTREEHVTSASASYESSMDTLSKGDGHTTNQLIFGEENWAVE